jgi:hypothetical protein
MDRYTFSSHRPIEQLRRQIPPAENGSDLKILNAPVDLAGGGFALRVTYGTGGRWRFPEQIASVTFTESGASVSVAVSIRLDLWGYLFGYGFVLVGVLFLYGALFEHIYAAAMMYGIGLFFFHLQILTFPQRPDTLADLLVKQFDLLPHDVTAARSG